MNPLLKELIELQHNVKSSTQITFPGCTREDIKNNLNKAFQKEKEKMRQIKQQELQSILQDLS